MGEDHLHFERSRVAHVEPGVKQGEDCTIQDGCRGVVRIAVSDANLGWVQFSPSLLRADAVLRIVGNEFRTRTVGGNRFRPNCRESRDHTAWSIQQFPYTHGWMPSGSMRFVWNQGRCQTNIREKVPASHADCMRIGSSDKGPDRVHRPGLVNCTSCLPGLLAHEWFQHYPNNRYNLGILVS